jgi:hypothetical protein
MEGRIDRERTKKKMMASKAVRGCHQAPEKWVMGWTSVSLVAWFSQWTKPPFRSEISHRSVNQPVPRWDVAPIVRRPLSAHVVHSPWRQLRQRMAWHPRVGSVELQTYSDLSDLEISSNLSRQATWCIKANHIWLRQKHLGLLDLMQIDLPWYTLVAHFRNVCNQGSCTAQHNSLCWTHS